MPVVVYDKQQNLFPQIDSRDVRVVDPVAEQTGDSFDGFFTIKEAAAWASEHLQRKVSNANISYLINYGKVTKYSRNGAVVIMKDELEKYYSTYHGQRQVEWKDKLGDDHNWALSFDNLPEK